MKTLPRPYHALLIRPFLRSTTPAWVVLVALLLSATPARAQDDGDSSSRKPKPAPTAQPKLPQPSAKPGATPDAIKKEGRELFNPSSSSIPGAPGDAQGWSIVLVAIRGDDREALAARTLNQVRTQGGLPEAYAAKRREAVIIAVGDFPTPDDPKAKSELTRIQNLEINGNKPYAGAMLAPPLDFKLTGSMPQFNLLRATELSGGTAIYTLQVAVYGRMDVPHPSQQDLAEPRKAAEEATARLRQEGEQAWYYHGPTMSMVCIGSFDQTDFDPQTPSFKSQRLRDTQKRHPYNLYNGAGIKVKRKGETVESMQSSSLVAIPKN